jgi:hypothetical protein
MSIEPSTTSHPIDEIEPEIETGDEYKQASRRFAQTFDAALWRIPPSIELFVVAFAVGSSRTEGRSMAEIASKYGYTRAAISKGVKSFQRSLNIRPIRGTQKDQEACQTYKDKRLEQLLSR